MPQIIRRLWIVLALAPLIPHEALAQTSADLSWRWTESQELTYRSRATTVQRTTGDQPSTATWTHEIEHTDRVLSVDDAGTASIQREYTRVIIDVRHSQQGNAHYDSTAPNRSTNAKAAQNPLIQPFAALAGRKITFNVSAEGDVSNVRGLREAMRAIANPLASNPSLTNALDMFNVLTPENFERQLEQSLKVMPARSVRRGEKWQVVVEQPMPIVGTVRSTTEYTFSRFVRERGRSLALVRASSEINLDPTAASQGLQGLIDISMTNATAKGELRIDTDLGAIRSWKQDQRYTFTVKAGMLAAEQLQQSVSIEQTASMELISGDR